MVERLRIEHKEGMDNRILAAPRKVYPETRDKRVMHYLEETDDYVYPNAWPKHKQQKQLGKAKSKKVEVVEEEDVIEVSKSEKQLS